MAHWAGSYFPTGFGPRAKLQKINLVTPTASQTGSTEGSDQLTLALGSGADLGAGLYIINVVIVQRTQSNAATSDAIKPVLSYTNEVATRSAVDFTVPSAVTVNHKTASVGVEQAWSTLIRVSTGNIVVALNSAIVGAKSAGAIDLHVTIEKVGSDN